MARKKTPTERQYFKERRRLQSQIRRLTKKGYSVEFVIPAIPKRITEGSVRRLQKITARKVREMTFAPDLETGEKINYQLFKNRYPRVKEIESVLNKPTEWDMSIEYVENLILDYPERSHEIFSTALSGAISVYGRRRVGIALSLMIEAGEIVSAKDAYNVGAILEMSRMLGEYLRLDNETMKEAEKDFNNELDSYEYYEGEFFEWN